MTTLSFRTDEQLVAELDRVVRSSGSNRSALLERALREFLYRLACERDAEAYAHEPLTDAELIPTSNQAWPARDDASW